MRGETVVGACCGLEEEPHMTRVVFRHVVWWVVVERGGIHESTADYPYSFPAIPLSYPAANVYLSILGEQESENVGKFADEIDERNMGVVGPMTRPTIAFAVFRVLRDVVRVQALTEEGYRLKRPINLLKR
ncbi:hypothetical protein Pmani_010238 [Petrolisthes manimaculis]|uniref:Uncharacterized protein n=1 Tax=Petrolisthes manimaculis TaxID=1843537 RepID=A0AAE1UH07_9EUCA|nr:hypothetical protein Pmani_010238 [Petrolisthes manimaculis]